jgi:tRNA(Ile)-lysidine synthase
MAHSISFSRLITGPSGKVLTLPESILVEKRYENVLVYKTEQDISDQPELCATEIAIPGTTKIRGWEIRSYVYADQSDKIIHNTTKFVAHLNSAMLDGTVYVRARMNGDRFQPTGMQNSKKIQDFMVDEKIPKDLRNTIPLVVSEKGICWIVGHRIAEWAKHDKAHNTVVIEFTKTEY